MKESQSSEPSNEEYLLIRVPKNINPNDLSGVKVNLNGDRFATMTKSGNDDYRYTYDFISNQAQTFYMMNKIEKNENDELILDKNFTLRGCVNFYKWHLNERTDELKPLESACPNDSIENIVNRNTKAKSKKQETKRKSENTATEEKGVIKKKRK